MTIFQEPVIIDGYAWRMRLRMDSGEEVVVPGDHLAIGADVFVHGAEAAHGFLAVKEGVYRVVEKSFRRA